jgi:hypothetical protein
MANPKLQGTIRAASRPPEPPSIVPIMKGATGTEGFPGDAFAPPLASSSPIFRPGAPRPSLSGIQ